MKYGLLLETSHNRYLHITNVPQGQSFLDGWPTLLIAPGECRVPRERRAGPRPSDVRLGQVIWRRRRVRLSVSASSRRFLAPKGPPRNLFQSRVSGSKAWIRPEGTADAKECCQSSFRVENLFSRLPGVSTHVVTHIFPLVTSVLLHGARHNSPRGRTREALRAPLRRQRPRSYQPRATPWVHRPTCL